MTSRSELKGLVVQKKRDLKMRFVHLRPKKGNHGVTVGYTVDETTKTCYYVVSRCRAGHDNFCRRIGREICMGRFLKHGPLAWFTYTDQKDLRKYFDSKLHPDQPDVILDGDANKTASNNFIPARKVASEQAPSLGC